MPRRSSMVFLSITIHVLMLSALVVASIVAPDILPSPRDVLDMPVERIVKLPDIPTPPTQRRPHQKQLPPAALFPSEGLPTVDPGLQVTESPGAIVDNDTGGTGDLTGLGGTLAAPPSPPPPPPPPIQEPIRLHSGIVAPKRTNDVAPDYPAIARATGISGVVILEVTITAHGDVAEARVLRSIALLDQAALDAVRRWKFTPARVNGEAISVVMTVTVNFQLNR